MTEPEPKKNKIRSLLRAWRLLKGINSRRPGARRSEDLYFQMMINYYTRLLDATQNGGFVASHTVFFPTEILYAMDIVPMHTELTTWLMAMFLGEQAELLAAGAELGLAPEICSPHRGLAGAFRLGVLPRPNANVWSNLICDNTAKSGELVMELNNCPGYFLDHPFQTSGAELRYLTGELKGLISFLEQQSGHKMDWARLSEIVARMDHEIELYREIAELRKATPSPLYVRGFMQLLSADYMCPGQPDAIAYLEAVRDELKEMVAAGKGAVSPERFRLMTLFIPPVFMTAFLEKISANFGAVSVVEPLFMRWGEGRLDPNRPLESVAQKMDMIPERHSMYGPLTQKALDDVGRCAEDYDVNGAVYWAFLGCRHTCATVKVFKDMLNRHDIPMLTVDCDLVDPTISPEAETRAKLEQYFEMLEDR